MFTFDKNLKDIRNEALRRREITVQFVNDKQHTKEITLSFSLTETAEAIKRAFQSYLDELNFVPPPVIDLTLPTAPVVTPPTQAELDRQEWQSDLNRLQRATKMAALGAPIIAGTQLTALQTRVRNNWKPEYEDLVPLN